MMFCLSKCCIQHETYRCNWKTGEVVANSLNLEAKNADTGTQSSPALAEYIKTIHIHRCMATARERKMEVANLQAEQRERKHKERKTLGLPILGSGLAPLATCPQADQMRNSALPCFSWQWKVEYDGWKWYASKNSVRKNKTENYSTFFR